MALSGARHGARGASETSNNNKTSSVEMTSEEKKSTEEWKDPFPNEPSWVYDQDLRGPAAYHNKLYDPYECTNDWFCTDKIQSEPSSALPVCVVDLIPRKESRFIVEEAPEEDPYYKESRKKKQGPFPVDTFTFLLECKHPYTNIVKNVHEDGTILAMRDLLSRVTVIEDGDQREHWENHEIENKSVLYERLHSIGPRINDPRLLHYIIFFWIKKERILEWEQIMEDQKNDVATNEPKTLHYSIYRLHTGDRTHFAIYEIFKNKQAREHHYTQPNYLEIKEWLEENQDLKHTDDDGYNLVQKHVTPPRFDQNEPQFLSDRLVEKAIKAYAEIPDHVRPEDIDWPLEWRKDVLTQKERVDFYYRGVFRDIKPERGLTWQKNSASDLSYLQ